VSGAPRGSGIVLEDVSKFYGEVLGVNGVSISIHPGITSLVGPNGSGKTTLMNLMTGLLRPTRGTLRVLGIPTHEPQELFRHVGYCTQYDGFPRGVTGLTFVESSLRLHGKSRAEARELAVRSIERVGMRDAADRKIAAYSKGMRQRIKLAQAMAHEPTVLVLDEPLNGLDPMARAEAIALFQTIAQRGGYVILSSHILHEVDLISDRVVLFHRGYVVAEGQIQGVRGEMEQHPIQILIRCDQPSLLASKVFELDSVVEVKLHEDHKGMLVRTRDAEKFYLLLNRLVLEHNLGLEVVVPADEDVESVYRYLIGSGGPTS
jgi:ABC-2 type transport system ATP-binding protein